MLADVMGKVACSEVCIEISTCADWDEVCGDPSLLSLGLGGLGQGQAPRSHLVLCRAAIPARLPATACREATVAGC